MLSRNMSLVRNSKLRTLMKAGQFKNFVNQIHRMNGLRGFRMNMISRSRMFENEQDQIAYEREKQALAMQGAPEIQQQENFGNEESSGEAKKPEPESTFGGVAFILASAASLYLISKYIMSHVENKIRNSSLFDLVAHRNLKMNTLTEEDETEMVALLDMIKDFVDLSRYLDEFYEEVCHL